MATGKALNGKPYAGNPHVRFDEGADAPKRSGRSALLYRTKRMSVRFGAIGKAALVAAAIFAAMAPLSSQADTGPLNGTPDDVRVAPLVTAHWNQGDAGGQRCYNYYTPLNRVCGCTATALGQIMYYHKYPTERILPGETLYDSIDGYGSYSVGTDGNGGMTRSSDGLYTAFDPPYGGPYDWSSMVDSPTGATSENSRKAIGLLTRDAGFAVFSHYYGAETSGYNNAIASSVILNLHYADAVRTGFNANKLIANLDAGLPIQIGLQRSGAGHAVVADGYGYHDGKLYIHINYGFSGKKDGWYDPTTDINGMNISAMVANIFPPTRGERHSSVISGRVLDANGNPVANATVTATGDTTATTTSSEKGIYAFVLPAGDYTFTATSGDNSGAISNCVVEASEQKTRAEGDGWENGVNNSMSGVNVTLGKTAGANEPDEYLEYVESDGRQAVDTGVTPGPNTATPAVTNMIVDADLEWISGGYMLSSNWNDFHPLKNNEDKIGASFKNSSDVVMNLASGKSLNSGRHRVVTTVGKDQPFTVDVDGVKSTSSGNVAAKGSGRTLYAFASNNGSTAGDGHSTAKLYGMKIYVNDELVRDFVPAIKGGVAGLYDRQNDKWYASQSGTALIAGPVYVPSTAKQATLKVSGYRKMGTIENFQVLVKLSDGDDYGFSYADYPPADGSDLWFTDAEGTLIPHDIDTWNTNGASFVWVKIPSLAYNTTITMHWGEARTQEQTCNPSDTWEGFVGVWHMNETGTDDDPDKTGHGLNAAPIDNSSTSTSINTDTNGGQIGNGRAVSQATMFKVSGHASHISEAKTFTIGGWVKRTGSGDFPRIFVGNQDNTTSGRTKWEVYGWSATELIARGGGDTDFKRSVDLSTSAGWKYLTVVYTGTTATIYDNGAPVGNAGAINNAVQDSYFTIGAVSGAGNRSFVGTFDEVRMYNGALSADRIAADYATMNNPTTFITLDVPPQNEPDVYIDYVESDGRQAVDTGVTPGPTESVTPAITSMKVDADLEWISGDYMVSSGWNDFHPLKNNDDKIGASFKQSSSSVVHLASGKNLNSGRCRVVTTVVKGQKFTIDVDGVTATSSGNAATLGAGRTLYAFASNNGSTAGGGHSTAKLYGMKIYINNEIVRDFVPGIKNGVAGLYDRVNDVWYVSQSGVPLNPGPVTEPHNTPDAYLDYVKSTGAQWVSVGITPTQTMKFDVDVDWISGNALMAQSNYGLSPLTVNNGTIVSRWWMADTAASANTGVGLDTGRRRFVITTSNSANLSASVDGGAPALSGGYSNRGGVNPSDLYIFAVHYGGTVGNAGEFSTAKLYGLKIYSNGVLMRDYVPGIKDNVAGLYDRVNDKFFSSGSGTPFVAGPVVDRSKPDAFVEYVESNGSQWVDTGVDGRAGVKSEADIDWISGNAPLAVYGNNHCFLLQALGTIGGQALGSGEVKTGIPLDSGRHLIVSEVPAGSKMTVTVDGTTAQSPNNVSASGNTGMTIWMFAAHSSGGAWGAGSSKFYELKLWRTGSDGVSRIQHHFIPCVKGGRAGLYDAVSGVIFYSHSGTDLVASSTTRTLSVWRNEADDASLDNAANWCGGLPNGTDAEVCAPWVPAVSSTSGLAFASLTVSGGDLAFANGTNTVAGALAADGALAFTNLVINGSADCAVAISGFISGHGMVKSLTLAEGARFVPDGAGYLTVSDALDGTMLIDMTGIDLSGVTGRFPLFKTGTAEILPTADAVEFVGGSAPSGRSLVKVSSGFGYDLGLAGFFILLR